MGTNYENLEASASASEPVELYAFRVWDQEYLYTSADKDILWQGKKYFRAALQRGAIDGTTDPDKGVMKLTASYQLPIVQQILVISPSFPITLDIYRTQRRLANPNPAEENPNEPISLQEDPARVWTGRIQSCEITGDEVSINAVNILNQQHRMGNTLRYQKACPYALYEPYNCRVPITALRTTVPIDSDGIISSARVRSEGLVWGNFSTGPGPAKPDSFAKNWFVGGYINYFDTFANVNGRRAITEYDPEQGIVTVFPPLRGYQPGTAIQFHAGCSHNTKDCHGKFDNIENYGGDPILPVNDPYDPFAQVF